MEKPESSTSEGVLQLGENGDFYVGGWIIQLGENGDFYVGGCTTTRRKWRFLLGRVCYSELSDTIRIGQLRIKDERESGKTQYTGQATVRRYACTKS